MEPTEDMGAALRASVVPVTALDAGLRQQAWSLFEEAYAGADRIRFEQDLSAKHRVILLWAADGSLRGFSTVHVAALASGAGTVVYTGDTVVARAYWGTKVLQRAFALLLVREKLRRPARPLYWLLVSKGYKTYLMLAHAFPQAVPRRDARGSGELHRVLDAAASSRFGEAFDPATGLIRHAVPRECVRDGLCPIDTQTRRDPDVAFFLERNPGHAAGDELACLAKVRLRDVGRQIVRSLRNGRRRASLPRSRPAGRAAR